MSYHVLFARNVYEYIRNCNYCLKSHLHYCLTGKSCHFPLIYKEEVLSRMDHTLMTHTHATLSVMPNMYANELYQQDMPYNNPFHVHIILYAYSHTHYGSIIMISTIHMHIYIYI